MKEREIGKNILKKIKESHLRPKPKWSFLLKNYIVWGLGVFSLVIGSLAVSVMVYVIKNDDWDVYGDFGHTWAGFATRTLPYYWIGLLILLVIVALYNFKHTKRGYRLRPMYIVFSSVLLSFVIGFFLYNAGVGQALEGSVAKKLPLYEKMNRHRLERWQKPAEGFLAGQIITVVDTDKFNLIDLNGQEWQVVVTTKKLIMPNLIKPQTEVRMIGNRLEKRVFEAFKVMPANPMFKRWMNEHHQRAEEMMQMHMGR